MLTCPAGFRTLLRGLGLVCAVLFMVTVPSIARASCGDYLQIHRMSRELNQTRPLPGDSAPLPSCRCQAGECRSVPAAPLPSEFPGWIRGLPQSAWWWCSAITLMSEADASSSCAPDERYRSVTGDAMEHVPIV